MSDTDGTSVLRARGLRKEYGRQAGLVRTVALVALAVLNAVFTAWAAALDARHSSALARALGASPQQVSGGLAAGQMLPALAGALLGIPLGIPLGIGLFKAVNGSGQAVVPSASWLVTVVLATLFGVALLTSIPARIAARRRSAQVPGRRSSLTRRP
jgi:putative ABC transport system permease protein